MYSNKALSSVVPNHLELRYTVMVFISGTHIYAVWLPLNAYFYCSFPFLILSQSPE